MGGSAATLFGETGNKEMEFRGLQAAIDASVSDGDGAEEAGAAEAGAEEAGAAEAGAHALSRGRGVAWRAAS